MQESQPIISGDTNQMLFKSKQVASSVIEETDTRLIQTELGLRTETDFEKSIWNGIGELIHKGMLKKEVMADFNWDRLEENEPQGLLLPLWRMKKTDLVFLATILDARWKGEGLPKGQGLGTCVMLKSDRRKDLSPVCITPRAAERVNVPSFTLFGPNRGVIQNKKSTQGPEFLPLRSLNNCQMDIL